MLKLILLLLFFILTSCSGLKYRYATFEEKQQTPMEKRDSNVERCTHSFIDKNVRFAEAVDGCGNIIYKERSI